MISEQMPLNFKLLVILISDSQFFRFSISQILSFVSIIIVTGPSLTRATSIMAPNSPH